jgi:thioredoxin-like negative regulator of GroEL
LTVPAAGENVAVSSPVAAPLEARVDEKPRLVFFYGKTSGPCRRVEAFLSQVLQRRHNHETFRLVRVCAERHPDLLDHFCVSELPTIFVVDRRRVQARVVAPRGRRELEEALAPWLR